MANATKAKAVEKAGEKTTTEPSRSRIEINLPQKTYLLIIAALLVPYFIAGGYFFTNRSGGFLENKQGEKHVSSNSPALLNMPDKAMPGNVGPWGNLEYLPMSLEIPEEYLSVQADEKAERRWFFRNAAPEQVRDFLIKTGFTSDQQKELSLARIESANGNVYLTPTKELIFSMSPAVRQKIYRYLAQFPENNWQREAFIFPKDSFESFFAHSELPSKTVSLVKQLCYPHEKVLIFADLPYVLDTLATYDDKLKLEKAISRRSTMLIRLHLTPDSDINGLLNYWGRAGRSKDLKPLLESLTAVPGGARLNLAIMLPPMPSSRIYTFPFPSLNQVENCHWTSFNFFKDPPSGDYANLKSLKEKLDAEYYPVFSDTRYGDLVFLIKPNGEIVHSAVYIADDIVFTKNGGHFTAPWLLMKIPALIESYAAFAAENQPLQMMYYRNKYY